MKTGDKVLARGDHWRTATVIEDSELLGDLPADEFVVLRWDGCGTKTVTRLEDVELPFLWTHASKR